MEGELELTARALGFVVGEKFTLVEDDWVGAEQGKSLQARIGLIADNRIKKELQCLLAVDVEVPEDRYALYDFSTGNVIFDIKTYSYTSITISKGELDFAAEATQDYGFHMAYMIFKQEGLDPRHETLTFEGFISYKKLKDSSALRSSRFNYGSYIDLRSRDYTSLLFS